MAQRYSKKREAILAVMRSTTEHPTAEWVYEKLKPDYPDLSLATVYRNIGEFCREGRAMSVGVVDGRERFDANVMNHGHFVCAECGTIIDTELDSAHLPQLCGDAAGSQVTRCEVTFRGICKKCVSAHSNNL